MGIIGKVIGVLLLVLVGLFGGKGMTTKTVTSLQAPIAVTAGVWYQATGYVSADIAGIATGTHEILWYNEASADDGSTTPIGSEDIFDGAIPEFDSMVSVDTYAYSKIVQAPEGATEARGQATAIGTTGGGHNVDWGVLSLALAADRKTIVPGNVLPSHSNFGASVLFNGGVDIPNIDTTFADAWSNLAGSSWDTGTVYQGTHSIRMGADSSIQSPPVRWPLGETSPVRLVFANNYTFVGGSPVVGLQAVFLDFTGAEVGTQDMLLETSAAFDLPNDSTWRIARTICQCDTAPADTAQVAFRLSIVGGDVDTVLYVDAFYAMPQSDTATVGAVQFHDLTTGVQQVPRLSSIDGFNLRTSTPIQWPDDTIQSSAPPYDIYGSISGQPTDAQAVQTFVAVRDFTLPSALAGSRMWSEGPAGDRADFAIFVNASPMWRARFPATGDQVAVFTNTGASGDTAIAGGDIIQIYAPSPPDSGLTNIGWTLVGILP